MSLRAKKRIRLFEGLALFAGGISSSIRYSAADISTLLRLENREVHIEFIDRVSDMLETGGSLRESWSRAVSEISAYSGITAEDMDIIIQFGSRLGATDVTGQTEHCDYFRQKFLLRAEKLEKEYDSKSKLYRSLGFFSGLSAAVVLI